MLIPRFLLAYYSRVACCFFVLFLLPFIAVGTQAGKSQTFSRYSGSFQPLFRR